MGYERDFDEQGRWGIPGAFLGGLVGAFGILDTGCAETPHEGWRDLRMSVCQGCCQARATGGRETLCASPAKSVTLSCYARKYDLSEQRGPTESLLRE